MTTIVTQTVERLSVPLEDFGLLAKELNAFPATKRKRKTSFMRLRKYMLLSGLISGTDTIQSIALGLDAAGAVNVEVTLNA